jgi:integrase
VWGFDPADAGVALAQKRAKELRLTLQTAAVSDSEYDYLLRKHLKPAAKKLGLSGVTWHLLRHSHATMLDVVGTPIRTMQALLGHSAPEITREVYLHAIPKEQSSLKTKK